MWLEWRDSEQQRQEESRTAANKPRDQFISRLLARLKQQQNQSHSEESRSQGQLGEGRTGDDEPEESWENLAGLDIGEGGEEPDDKSGKRGGRKEGASLEASRELFKKLKKSALAHKLQVNTPNRRKSLILKMRKLNPTVSSPLRQNESSFPSSSTGIGSWRLCSATPWWSWPVRRAAGRARRFHSSS